MSTANKLAFLGVTKSKIKDVINMTGVGITNDTFRSYAQSLYNGYIATLKDKGTLLDNMNKGTSTGTISDSANLPVYEYKASKLSTQNTTTGKNMYNDNFDDYTQPQDYRIFPITLEQGQTYTLSAELVGNKVTGCLVGVVASGDKYSEFNLLRGCVNTTGDTTNSTFTITDVYTSPKLAIYASSREKFNDLFSNYHIQLEKNNQATSYEQYTEEKAAPNPSFPMEVKTVKGYRNLFDKNSGTSVNSATKSINNEQIQITGISGYSSYYWTIDVSTLNSVIISGSIVSGSYSKIYILKDNDFAMQVTTIGEFKNTINVSTNSTLTIYLYANSGATLSESTTSVYENIMLSAIDVPYVPYGNNYIYTTISDGTNSRQVLIPLNNNEICGIGAYLDELVIDKYGHAKLNKKIGKVVLDGSNDEDWNYLSWSGANRFNISIADSKTYNDVYSHGQLCNRYHYDWQSALSPTGTHIIGTFAQNQNTTKFYFIAEQTSLEAFRQELVTNNVELYYPLATPTEIDLGTIEMELYEGTNNITNSENMDMSIRFIKSDFE